MKKFPKKNEKKLIVSKWIILVMLVTFLFPSATQAQLSLKSGVTFGKMHIKENDPPAILKEPAITKIMTIFDNDRLFGVGLIEIRDFKTLWDAYGAKIYVGKGGLTLRGKKYTEGTKLLIAKDDNPTEIESFGFPQKVVVVTECANVLKYPLDDSEVLAAVEKRAILSVHFSCANWYLIELSDKKVGWIQNSLVTVCKDE